MIINGNLILRNSSIQSLGDLTKINGDLKLQNCENIRTLGKLKKSLWRFKFK